MKKALHIYKQLKDKAASMERRQLAKTGMLRSAHMLGNEEEIIFTATDLLADTKLAPELSNEAHYYRAKSLFGCRQDGWSYGRSEDLGKRHP